jgi:hypothetical protein
MLSCSHPLKPFVIPASPYRIPFVHQRAPRTASLRFAGPARADTLASSTRLFDSRQFTPHSWTPTVSHHTNATGRTGLFTHFFITYVSPTNPTRPAVAMRAFDSRTFTTPLIHLPDTDGTRRRPLFWRLAFVFDGASIVCRTVEPSLKIEDGHGRTLPAMPPVGLGCADPSPHPSSSVSHSTCPLCPPDLLTPTHFHCCRDE